MKDFKDLMNSDISDELLATYIDGNTTESENQLIEVISMATLCCQKPTR